MPVIPHSFQDNVDEVASGVQVDENFDVLNAAITTLEGKQTWAAPTARTPRAFNTNFLASGTRNTIVIVDFQLAPGGGFAADVGCYVGGQQVAGVHASAAVSGELREAVTFPVPAGEEWRVLINTGTVTDLHSSYTFV